MNKLTFGVETIKLKSGMCHYCGWHGSDLFRTSRPVEVVTRERSLFRDPVRVISDDKPRRVFPFFGKAYYKVEDYTFEYLEGKIEIEKIHTLICKSCAKEIASHK
jgi:hypothetical protein